MSRMSVSERLTALAKAAGFANASEFARAAGVQEGTMRQHINRDRIPVDKAELYIAAAEGTEATIDWLLTGKGQPPVQRTGPPLHKSDIGGNLTLRGRVTTATLPVWEVVPLPDGRGAASLKTNVEPIDYVERPHTLKSAKRAFAIRLWDDAMAPAFRKGDTIFTDPGTAGIPGQDVLFIHTPVQDRQQQALARHLLGETETTWRVAQFTPAKTYSIQKADWPDVWKIQGKYSR